MEENKKMGIELKGEIAAGHYANLAIITHSKNEFILDFAAMLPGMPQPSVQSRIVMTPEHCKRLLEALTDNIQKYESQFSEIETSEPINPLNLVDLSRANGTKS